MTLELTPDQLQDLKATLQAKIKSLDMLLNNNDPRLTATGVSNLRKYEAEKQRLESLHDLLTHSTAVLLYRP